MIQENIENEISNHNTSRTQDQEYIVSNFLDQEFDVIKYNYRTGKSKNTKIYYKNKQFFYKTKYKNCKYINNIIGTVYGSRTTTFLKVSDCKQWLCASMISLSRTYDFEFKNLSHLWLFLFLARKNHQSIIEYNFLDIMNRIFSNNYKQPGENNINYFHRIRNHYKFQNLKSCRVDTDCPICFERTQNNIITECDHIFCKDCIEKWMSKNDKCPLCRENIN